MGDKKRMGDTGDKVILYAAQADAVLKAIERDGRCFSREEYVRRNMGKAALFPGCLQMVREGGSEAGSQT